MLIDDLGDFLKAHEQRKKKKQEVLEEALQKMIIMEDKVMYIIKEDKVMYA